MRRQRLARRDRPVRGGRAPSSSTSVWRRCGAARTDRGSCWPRRRVEGYRSLGWPDGGRIAPAAWPTSTSVALTSPRLGGNGSRSSCCGCRVRGEPPATSTTSSSAASDVVRGRGASDDRRCRRSSNDRSQRCGHEQPDRPSSTTSVGCITNDAQFEVGATGELRDAWVVMVDGLDRSGRHRAGADRRSADRRRRSMRDAGVRRQPQPSRVRRRSLRRVRGPHGGRGRTRPAAFARRSPPPAPRPTTSCVARSTSLLAEARRSGTTTIEIKSGLRAHRRARGPHARASLAS